MIRRWFVDRVESLVIMRAHTFARGPRVATHTKGVEVVLAVDGEAAIFSVIPSASVLHVNSQLISVLLSIIFCGKLI